jgi:anti-sigma regulatory factor (Ser/Thr protein kinase)
MSTTDVANAERFERFGLIADARSAATTRIEFAQWLRQFFDLDSERANDLILAIYEALANSAEFAYAGAGHPGTMDVEADYDPAESKITVRVSDRGEWRTAESPRRLSRGRGIPLMQALADHASIDATAHGTSVRMEWTNVGRRAVAG